MGFLSDIFDPGRRDREAAAGFAEEGRITGGDFVGPGGIRSGFDFSGGRTSVTADLGSFAPLLEQLQAQASGGITQAGGGLPPELTELGGSTIDRLGQIDVNRLQNQQDFSGLGGIFQSALGTAQADPFDLGADISSRLRDLSSRRNERKVNKFFDRLKSTGNLTSSAGIQRAGDLERNIFEQGLQFDLAGLQAGQGIQQAAFGRVLGASGQREAIGARQFGEEFGLEQLGGQRSLQQFGVGSSIFDQFLRSQRQGADIGMQSTASAAGLSQLPLAFLQTLQGLGTSASNTAFAQAGISQENAALAQSPFLEALNAAGSFMTAIKPTPAPTGG